jgi:hypothetical protein
MKTGLWVMMMVLAGVGGWVVRGAGDGEHVLRGGEGSGGRDSSGIVPSKGQERSAKAERGRRAGGVGGRGENPLAFIERLMGVPVLRNDDPFDDGE